MPTDFASAQLALDLVGVFVIALSGGLVAVEKRFDLVGVIALACVAGLGGGVVRDVLIGAVAPVGISDWRLLAAAALGGLATFLFQPGIERIGRLVKVRDAAVGGLLRDLLAGQVPEVLRRELYAVPALLGAVIVVVLVEHNVLRLWMLWAAATLVVGVRLVAIRLDLKAPTLLRSGLPG
jgi:uncharacterized membrane protein YeiH